LPELLKNEAVKTVPIEGIGVVILDYTKITITQVLLTKLLEANVAAT